MKSKAIICMIVAVVLAGFLGSTLIAKDKQKDLEAKAKVSRVEAEKTALEKFPGGKIKEGELEEEDGKLIWAFDIATDGSKKLQEVEIDALTGKVLSGDAGKEGDEEKESGKEEDKDDDEKGEKEDNK